MGTGTRWCHLPVSHTHPDGMGGPKPPGALLMSGDLIAAPQPRRGDMGVTTVWGTTRGSPNCSHQAAVLLSLQHTKYPKGA